MECASRDEQHVIGPDIPVSRLDRRPLYDGQHVTLDSAPRHIRPRLPSFTRHLVQFVNEDDAVVFDTFQRFADHLIHVHELA